MAMPACGTFHYIGVVPGTKAARESGKWKLHDRSTTEPECDDVPAGGRKWFWRRASPLSSGHERLRRNRLVGLYPTLRLSGPNLILEATDRHAEMSAAFFEVDQRLIDALGGADVLTIVRAATADIGLSVLRDGDLVFAVGAVTLVPLGGGLTVRGGPLLDLSKPELHEWPRKETWLDVASRGEVVRLEDGAEKIIDNYQLSVLHCFQDGIPGTHENVAITRARDGLHEAAVTSARLLGRFNAGLAFRKP